MNVDEQIEKFKEFFESYYYSNLVENVRQGKNFLVFDFQKLVEFDHELADLLIENPEEILKAAELSIKSLELGKEITKFNARLKNLPEAQKIMIRTIRSKHITKLIFVQGVVRQKSDVRPQVTSAKFECPSCGNIINVLQLDDKFKEPTRCGCGRKGKFILLDKELIDAQGIIVEESPEDLEGGEQPKRINVFLKDDLVSPISEKLTNPGSKILVIGLVKEVPIITKSYQSTRFDLLIEAIYTEPIEEDFYALEISKEEAQEILELSKDKEISSKLINSVAPSIFGYERVKEALLLQMVGGIKKTRSDGVVSRGDMHILLIGDPGSGKSALLKRVSKIAPKARYVTGKGVSAAGLTASVVKDEFLKGWALEAGALVLANKGIVCIDELDKMSAEDRGAMHEALEQQSLHYNTIINLADGSEIKIGDFVEDLFIRYPERIIRGKDCFVLPVKDLDYGLFSTDWLKIFKTKIDRISKHKAPAYFIQIKVWNGRNIVVTPEHPVFCLEDGRIITKSADDLKGDEWLPIPLDIPLVGEEQKFDVAENEVFIERASRHITVPSHNSPDFFKITGYLLTEGSKELNRGKLIGVNFTNKDRRLLEDFKKSMKNVFGLLPYEQARIDHYDKRWMLRYISRELAEFMNKICPTVIKKANEKEVPQILMRGLRSDIALMLSCMFEGDGHVSKKPRTIRVGFASNSRRMCEQVQDLLLRFGVRSNLTEHKLSYKVLITGYYNIYNFRENIGFVTEEKNKIIEEYLNNKRPIRTIKDIIPNISEKVIELMEKYGVRDIGTYKFSSIKFDHVAKGCGFSKRMLQKILKLLEPKINKEDIEIFNFLKKLALGSIGWERIKEIKKIKNIDQKWAYDVTIEPNHTFISQNLVLHNTVTISKANIQATLMAETTVLAAANPKMGRFDSYELIAKQINLPPTLINRFDLIFPIKDLPRKDRDEQMASHILSLHKNPEARSPVIPTNKLKKYIAYARQKCVPKLTESALETIKNFYVEMRNSETTEGGTPVIPITARQLEALVRLSEAYAKLRLSETITKKDAQKAIDLLKFCLQQVGVDPETGKIDIDVLATGITSTQRNKVHVIKDIISDLENEVGKTIMIGDIIKRAEENNISATEVEELVENLKRNGDLFEPKRGFIQRL